MRAPLGLAAGGWVRALLVIAVGSFAGLAVPAQELVEGPVPEEYDNGSVEHWAEQEAASPFHAKRFEDTYATALEAGAIAGVAEDLVRSFQPWTGARAAPSTT